MTTPRSTVARRPSTIPIVVHNYRWRLSLAEGEPKYAELEKQLAEFSVIAVPAITLETRTVRRVRPPTYAKKFSGKYEHRQIEGGIGHNLPQEAPQAFVQAILDVARN